MEREETMKRAWIFPGQGSQYIGMGKNFFEQFDLVKNYFERASQVLSFDLAKLCLTGQEEELKLTFNAQPAILTLSVALAELLIEKGVPRPQIIAGHSLGEFSALVFNGNLQFEDAIAIVHERGLAMQEAVPKGEGGMLALVGGNFDQVKEMLKHLPKGAILEVANDNGGGQIIVSGNLAGNDCCKNEAKNHGIRRAMPLPVSAPFHSS